jgi:hypothetical protein
VIAVDPRAELYKVNWKTGDSNLDATKTYRVRVLVGATELGYRDVDPADSPNEVPNNADQLPVYAFLNGSTIPLKWRIEYGALCDPSVPADLCGEGTIDLAQGGSVQNSKGQSGCGDDDTSVTDGTLDGSGAFTNNGTYTMYEVAHPLTSGDIGHDYSLNVGSKVGVFASLRLGSGAQGNTQVPGFRQYLEITIK